VRRPNCPGWKIRGEDSRQDTLISARRIIDTSQLQHRYTENWIVLSPQEAIGRVGHGLNEFVQLIFADERQVGSGRLPVIIPYFCFYANEFSFHTQIYQKNINLILQFPHILHMLVNRHNDLAAGDQVSHRFDIGVHNCILLQKGHMRPDKLVGRLSALA
jgi:hypothetical protein